MSKFKENDVIVMDSAPRKNDAAMVGKVFVVKNIEKPYSNYKSGSRDIQLQFANVYADCFSLVHDFINSDIIEVVYEITNNTACCNFPVGTALHVSTAIGSWEVEVLKDRINIGEAFANYLKPFVRLCASGSVKKPMSPVYIDKVSVNSFPSSVGKITICQSITKSVDMNDTVNEMQVAIAHLRLEAICHEFGLTDALEFIKKNNHGNSNHYHNTHHCMGVALLAYDIAFAMNLKSAELSGLLLACLFHDFDHTAADVPDTTNIKLALRGLDLYRRTSKSEIPELIYTVAEACIKVTEFPFVHEPVTEYEKIIRDADVLYATASPKFIHVLEGLRDELSMRDLKNDMPLSEFVVKQKAFINSVKLYTHPGLAIMNSVRDQSFDVLDAYVKFVESD